MDNQMYTVIHIDQHGVTRKLLLTEVEYQNCLHRAQENPQDLDSPTAKSDGDCVDVY